MKQYDVCVFGAGPSGSAIAIQLLKFGYTVVIAEKENFPRESVGISLTPGVYHWLGLLHLRSQVEQAGFNKAYRATLLWEGDEPVKKEMTDEYPGLHVDRGHFDKILLQAAVDAGATLIQPFSNQSIQENLSGTWQVKLRRQTFDDIFTAGFIVEATGRKSVIQGEKVICLPSTLATYACWSLADNCSFIEAGTNHWCWGAPMGKNSYVACVFSDPEDVKQAKSIKDFYVSRIGTSTLLGHLLNRSMIKDVIVCAATPYQARIPVGRNYIRIGDAAFTVDPISSQGVQKAFKTAFQGAIVVNTIISQPQNALLAIDYYCQMINNEVKKNLRWTKIHYNNQSRYESGLFWKKRKNTSISMLIETSDYIISIDQNTRLLINPSAVIKPVPVIGSKFIEIAIGILLIGHDEPFVFIQEVLVVPLVKQMHNQDVTYGIAAIKSFLPRANPLMVLKWLLYNRILCPEKMECFNQYA